MQFAFLFWVSPLSFSTHSFAATLDLGLEYERAKTHQAGSHGRGFTDEAGGERWRQVLYRCRWTLMLSIVLSVSLTEVQNLAGSKPLSKSTEKLHGWFDCTSLLCWLHCWQICQKRGFLHLLLCIRCPMIDFAWGRYVYRFVNVFAPRIEWHTHHLCSISATGTSLIAVI